jgi:hypothetical protein
LDLLEAKSRIADALVESIFRRARYEVQRYRPNNVEDHEELVRRIMGLLTSV